MTSKQTKANRLNDVARLRQKADGFPLVIDVDQASGVYSVAFTNDPDYALIKGRYQIIATYIDGFTRGYVNSGAPPSRHEFTADPHFSDCCSVCGDSKAAHDA